MASSHQIAEQHGELTALRIGWLGALLLNCPAQAVAVGDDVVRVRVQQLSAHRVELGLGECELCSQCRVGNAAAHPNQVDDLVEHRVKIHLAPKPR